MRIGQLAEATGVPTRMLRYYEQRGLITPRRLANGYREYDDYLADRVRKISGLVNAGIPTRLIGAILPCLNQTQEIVVDSPDPELRTMLAEQLEKMTGHVAALEQNRDALARYIDALDRAGDLAR